MSADRRTLPAFDPDATSTTTAEQGAGTPEGLGADPSKTGLDAQTLRLLAAEIAQDFAPELGCTALVIYDTDPAHLQAQWNLAPEDVAHAFDAFPKDPPDLRQVLRWCRLGPDGQSQVVATSYQGKGPAPSWGQEGFTLPGIGGAYECELGLESADGGWMLLVRSNRIQLAVAACPTPEPGTSDGEAQTRGQRQIRADEAPQVAVEAALAAVGETLDPVFPNPGLVIDPASLRCSLPKTDPHRDGPRDQVPQTPLDPIREPAPGNGSGYAGSLLPTTERMPGPQLPLDPNSGLQAGMMPGPLYDPRAALSSAALRVHAPWGNDLKVQAELVVHGAGQPGARVELFGLPVRLGADGRFAVRRTVDAALLLSLARGLPSAPVPGDRDAE